MLSSLFNELNYASFELVNAVGPTGPQPQKQRGRNN